jgi:hypothetical protein
MSIEGGFITDVHSFLESLTAFDAESQALKSIKDRVVGLLTKHSGAALRFTATGAQLEIWDSTTGGDPRKLSDIPFAAATQAPFLTATFLATVAYCHSFSGKTVADWEALATTLCTAFASSAT